MPNEKHKAPRQTDENDNYRVMSTKNILEGNVKTFYGPNQPQTLTYSPPELWPEKSPIHPPRVVRISLMHFNTELFMSQPEKLDENTLFYFRDKDTANFAQEYAPSWPGDPLQDYYAEIPNAGYVEQERLRALFTSLKEELADEQIYIDIVDYNRGIHPTFDFLTMSNYEPFGYLFMMSPLQNTKYFGTNFLHLYFGMPHVYATNTTVPIEAVFVYDELSVLNIENDPLPYELSPPPNFPPLLSDYNGETQRFYEITDLAANAEQKSDDALNFFLTNLASEYSNSKSRLNQAREDRFRNHYTKIFGFNGEWQSFPPWPMTQAIEFIDDVSPGGDTTIIVFDATQWIDNRNPKHAYATYDKFIQKLIVADNLTNYGISWGGTSETMFYANFRTMIRDHFTSLEEN